jgi:hypothetical protein
MRLDIYFLYTLQDLRERLANQRRPFEYEYSLLKAAGLLRLLLIDGNPLVQLINRHYQEKLRFDVTKIPIPQTGITYWQAGDLLHPGRARSFFGEPTSIHSLTLDEFLVLPVVAMDTKVLSVRDAIKFFANAEGGVHREEQLKENAHLQCVRDLEGHGTRLDNCQPGLNMIWTIGHIVLDGLAPLDRRVSADKDAIWDAIDKEMNGIAVAINTEMRQPPTKP